MSDFKQLIYAWYTINKRNLPWRKTEDPYKIWISEIILQQTRIEQGLHYYLKFIETFPDIETLALASEDQVLKLWQGLGYYSRARNLHESAKIINTNHQGKFPSSYSEILSLKGVGPYTAAAVASIAFGLPHPVLDGNVFRLLARYFGILFPVDSEKGKKEFYKTAFEIMPKNNPGFHNEALMEFGALQCTPRSPGCCSCPLSSSCFAFNQKKVEQLPLKKKNSKKRMRYLYYYLIESGSSIWLEKRTSNDIWKNLYQFPLVETPQKASVEAVASLHPSFLRNCHFNIKSISDFQKHILSHQTLYARLINLEVSDKYELDDCYLQIEKKDFHKYAVPRLIEKLLENSGFVKF